MNLDFSPFETAIKENGMALVEASLSTNITTDFTTWNHHRICLVKRGELFLEFADGKIKLSNQEIVYLPTGVQQRWVTSNDSPAALFMICYDKNYFNSPPGLSESFDNFSADFPALRRFSPEKTIRAPTIRYLFKELLKEKRSKATDQKVVTLSLFLALVALLSRSQREIKEQKHLSPQEQSFSKSLTYLEENIQEKIGITELADIAGLSYRRYTEIFRAKTGMTANEYMREKRIALVQQLLLETGNILHSSLDAGFGDLTNFYRVFKQVTGVTPKQYMASQKLKSRHY